MESIAFSLQGKGDIRPAGGPEHQSEVAPRSAGGHMRPIQQRRVQSTTRTVIGDGRSHHAAADNGHVESRFRHWLYHAFVDRLGCKAQNLSVPKPEVTRSTIPTIVMTSATAVTPQSNGRIVMLCR